jgi:ABC-type transporter Mla maintaining outer membrane lipid asymmetry ATPase subunit MlaF
VHRCQQANTIAANKYKTKKPTSKETSLSDTLIKIRGLKFSRGSRVIFDDVNMDIPRKGITAIMGPSGTGKTTLLKLIGASGFRND